MQERLLKKLQALPAEFRGVPFWAWNNRLEPEILREQIHAMHKMGFGGFFIHSRFGLKTPYLGRKWFDCVRICIEEAEKLGMHAWLYDEDRWPSGTAGGRVTADRRYAMRGLDYEILDRADFQENDLAHFALSCKNGTVDSWRRIRHADELHPEEKFIRFTVKTAPPQGGYNNQPYLDTMNPEAVREFIRVTHESYKTELGDSFRLVPGFFTDEPEYRAFSFKHIWTDSLPQLFHTRYGYDLLDHLPELFFELRGCRTSKVRLNFHELATELFVNAYARQLGEWCERNGLAFTGHILGEDDLFSQMQSTGSAMRFYEYMQIPGIDILSEHWNLYAAAKQCSSVARQLGRPLRLCELYGCTGWDFPFEGHKAIGDWLIALGINLRVHHHFWYSMEGESKRDYPASISLHSPWHEKYHFVEDYFARINAILSEGEEVRHILVIHPIESIWFGRPLESYRKEAQININGYFVHTGQEKHREMSRLQGITDYLLGGHLDFDYGDEALLARHANIGNQTLEVGNAAYKAVVIPELLTIRKTTLELLRRFAENGGSVFYIGRVPEFVNGERSSLSSEIYALFKQMNLTDIPGELNRKFREVSFQSDGREAEALLHNLHRMREMESLFICNASMLPNAAIHQSPRVAERRIEYQDVQISWRLPHSRQVYELDLNTGMFRNVKTEFKDGHMIFHSQFPRLASRLFLASEEHFPTVPDVSHASESGSEITFEKFGYEMSEDNLLVLDSPEYSINGSGYHQAEHFLALDEKIRKMLELPPRSIMEPQPWFGHGLSKATLALRLRYRFSCRVNPEEIYLGVEMPSRWNFTLNGVPLSVTDCGQWCDSAIRKIRLPHLREGENLLEMGAEYGADSGLESLFLIGQFGVDENDTLVSLPATLQSGDWRQQGFPYYAGNMAYKTYFESSGESMMLNISDWSGAALGISLDKSPEILLGWPPYQLRLFPGKGTHELRIIVYGHRRNALGPFYAEAHPYLITPRTFREQVSSRKRTVPCGLVKITAIREQA